METFKKIVNTFETIATKHHELKSYHNGFLDEVDIAKLGQEDYYILYTEPGNTTINTGIIQYEFTVYVLDMIQEDLTDRDDAFNRTLNILHDVINEFKQNLSTISWVDDEIVLQLPISCEPFTAKFDNELTGWSSTLSIQANNTNNLCNAPIIQNT
jgi:hypothetical protein|tara:strand:+ start:2960 stop:3427 length:468 start_codon:yes stop_codon:yes gene_type:complete